MVYFITLKIKYKIDLTYKYFFYKNKNTFSKFENHEHKLKCFQTGPLLINYHTTYQTTNLYWQKMNRIQSILALLGNRC